MKEMTLNVSNLVTFIQQATTVKNKNTEKIVGCHYIFEKEEFSNKLSRGGSNKILKQYPSQIWDIFKWETIPIEKNMNKKHGNYTWGINDLLDSEKDNMNQYNMLSLRDTYFVVMVGEDTKVQRSWGKN